MVGELGFAHRNNHAIIGMPLHYLEIKTRVLCTVQGALHKTRVLLHLYHVNHLMISLPPLARHREISPDGLVLSLPAIGTWSPSLVGIHSVLLTCCK